MGFEFILLDKMLVNTLFVTIIFQFASTTNIAETKNKINELEKEKTQLYKQIIEAIDESIKSLQKSNKSDALIGIQYMYDLKNHLKKVNETIVDEEYKIITNNSDFDIRRRFDIKIPKKIKTNDPFDFESVLRPKKVSQAKWREIMTDRAKMQKQLNEWILKKEKEKERLNQYRLYKKGMIMSGKYEKCPRFGYKGKKKRASRDRYKVVKCKERNIGSDDENLKKCMNMSKDQGKYNKDYDMDLANIRRSKKNKYPCCRKCCKKSYMGCL